MQTGLISKQDTAAILGKACRTVEWYANRGFLSRVKQGRRVFFTSEEVYRLKRELGEEGRTDPEMAALRSRVKKLELDVSLLLRLLEARRHVDLTSGELEQLELRARTETAWSLPLVESWHAVLMSLEDSDLKRLPVGSWKSFNALATNILDALRNSDEWATSLQVQRLASMMATARRHLRATVLCGDELGRTHEELFGEPPDLKEELFALL